MPEFRFRRKKHQNRRHTLHDAEESSAQIQAAREQVVAREKKGNVRKEKEKLFELLQTKYPEETSSIQLVSNGQAPSMVSSVM